jgi:HPt (histidine-containing phosphotransfer) domain-containing protein
MNQTAEVQDRTEALLAALWLRNRPIVDQRLDVLERAAAASAAANLPLEQREEAADVAHKLAGSLGMYGYEHGTRLARQIELLLDYQTPDPVRLTALTRELRQTLTTP